LTNYPYENQNKKVFQCEHTELETLKKLQEKVYNACAQYMNQHVLVETLDGQTVQGTIVNVDNNHVYIQPAASDHRQYPYTPYPYLYPQPYPQPGPYPYNPYAQTILPLALFNLLAISLL
jgi:hypothetical protein